jgi:hypothetical protein
MNLARGSVGGNAGLSRAGTGSGIIARAMRKVRRRIDGASGGEGGVGGGDAEVRGGEAQWSAPPRGRSVANRDMAARRYGPCYGGCQVAERCADFLVPIRLGVRHASVAEPCSGLDRGDPKSRTGPRERSRGPTRFRHAGGLAIPCRVASQQCPTPLHQAGADYQPPRRLTMPSAAGAMPPKSTAAHRQRPAIHFDVPASFPISGVRPAIAVARGRARSPRPDDALPAIRTWLTPVHNGLYDRRRRFTLTQSTHRARRSGS